MNKPSLGWDPQDLGSLLMLDELAPWHYRNRYHDPNLNGRAFGGQVLGQALMAAGHSVPESRHAGAIQLLFLQGTKVNQAVDYIVTPLQDGKRFSSRHVRGVQGDTITLDAHISFQTALDGPSHTTPPPEGIPGPEALPRLSELNPELSARFLRLGGYSPEEKPSIDFRLFAPEQEFLGTSSSTRLYFWMRSAWRLPDVPHIQEAALAYLSDWWTNFCSLAPHIGSDLAQPGLNVVSLNHSLWIHRAPEVPEWMLVISESPTACEGRGLSLVRFYNRSGDLLASAAQECLIGPNHNITSANA